LKSKGLRSWKPCNKTSILVIKEKEHFKDELKNALNDKERTMNSLEQKVMKVVVIN
jgi:hypothetical protein